MLKKLSELFARWADKLDPQGADHTHLASANREIRYLRELESKIAAGEYGNISSATQEQIKQVHLACEEVTDAYAARLAGRGPAIHEAPADTIRKQIAVLREYGKNAPESERAFIERSADLYAEFHIISFDFHDYNTTVTRRGFLGMKR